MKQDFQYRANGNLQQPTNRSLYNQAIKINQNQIRFNNNIQNQIYPSAQDEPFKLPMNIRNTFLKRTSSQNQNQIINFNNVIYPDILRTTCKLCQNKFIKGQMETINGKCQHIFCHNCLLQYIQYKLNTMEEVRCPQEGCIQLMDVNSICFKALPEDFKNKHYRYQIWKQTINNPNVKLCPQQNCNGLIQIRRNYICPKCHSQFCPECMLKKHQGPCDVNFQKNFKDWKRCPQCKMFVDKLQGCNHITCRCNHQFCYVCLANWTQEHYSCGQASPEDLLRQNLRQISQCKKKIYGILLIILFPLILVLFTGLYFALSIIILAFAIILGPFIFMCKENQICNYAGAIICFLILLPIIMAFGLILGILFIIGNYFTFLQIIIKVYGIILSALCCSSQNQQNNQANNHIFDNQLVANHQPRS